MTPSSNLSKVTAKTAAEVCRDAKPEGEASQLLREGMTPRQYYDGLISKKLFVEAVRFLAHALPKREAIWWAAQCVKVVADPKKPEQSAAIQTLELWTGSQNDVDRRKLLVMSETLGQSTPVGLAALAGFFSGGSIGPEDAPEVPPPGHLTGHFVALAVSLGAQVPPPPPDAKLTKFLALGIDVASGANRWKEPAAAPAARR